MHQRGIELRWFTTLTEVNLCGHATLAAAYVLFNELDYPDSRLHFDTASGRLTVSREGDWMTLDFPACPTQAQTPPPEMLTALGISHYVEARKGRARVLVLESREQVEAINPDFSAMTPGSIKWPSPPGTRGIRLCQSFLLAGRGRAGRSCHRLRAHHADPLLE